MRFFFSVFLILCTFSVASALTLQEVSRIINPIDQQLKQFSHTRSRAWFLDRVAKIDSLLQYPDIPADTKQILTRLRVSFLQYAPIGFVDNTPPPITTPPIVQNPPKIEIPNIPQPIENIPNTSLPSDSVSNISIIETPKNIPTTGNIAMYREFFNTHGRSIVAKPNTPESKKMDVPTGCVLYFDRIDEIAKKRDFPVQLILANWRKETTCRLRNPDNGW